MRIVALSALVAAVLLDPDPRSARACAPAPPMGAEVRIADEEAVIVWDPATKVETFIRRAAFRSTARSFGFLVPTPSVPKLGETDASVFDTFAMAIRPDVVTDTSGVSVEAFSLFNACLGAGSKGMDEATARAPAVRVIASAHVAGFDATTVEADDPAALAGWLAGHGFAATPELTAWLARYVQDHWKITAFVVGTDEQAGQAFELATRAVKMTFQTERPFYPYREPEPARGASKLSVPPRMLRVMFVSDARYTGKLGEAPWQAGTLFSAPLDVPPQLAPEATGKRRTTVFVDDSSPRLASEEVYFVPNADQAEVKQPPVIYRRPKRIAIPVEAVVAIVVVLALWLRSRAKRRT